MITAPNWHILAQPIPGELHPLVTICAGEPPRQHIICNSCTPEDAMVIIHAVNTLPVMTAKRDALLAGIRLLTQWFESPQDEASYRHLLANLRNAIALLQEAESKNP